jgi:hypothetical protein
MRKMIAAFVLLVVLVTPGGLIYAQESVAGTWVMSFPGISMQMMLTQDGEKVSGTLDSPHGLVPLKGEFSKGKLTLAGAPTPTHPIDVSATATLLADGSLAGSVSVNQTEMAFTAVRKL